MPRGSDADIERANAIKEYILDAMTFDLNEEEAIQYISGRLGKKYKKGKNKDKTIRISRASYFDYKKLVKENLGNIDRRMFEHAKAGFVQQHFEIMDTAKRIYKHLTGSMFTTQNAIQKAALAQQARDYAYFIWQLNISSPVIDQMKQYVTEQLKSNDQSKDAVTPNDDSPRAESALLLPKGFFGSGMDTTNDGGRIPAGKESVDRVFEKPRKSEGETVLDKGSGGT
jgi:hypothetical protein